jgi:hypothetical protein
MYSHRRLPAWLAALLLCLIPAASPVQAQSLSGQVSGSLQDESGAAVTGARLVLKNVKTSEVRSATSDGTGTFLFLSLLPGTYELTVNAAGFKAYTQPEILVAATERVTLRPIQIAVGTLNESITITAQSARLQTQSSERSGEIGTRQIAEMPLKGRDYMATLRLLPGVIDVTNREAPRDTSLGININGARANTTAITLDGTVQMDTGNQAYALMTPAPETLQEVKVLLSNYQAEYGRSSTSINAVTKSGTREFHGGAYYFKRNEALNANDFFNNRDRVKRPRYRYDYPGYYIGGPVLLPSFNRGRDKLFFFFSQEFLPRAVPSSLNYLTVPTALERQGDFSQTLDTNGKLIPIYDPLNGKKAFAGNLVPANRIDARGQALLKFFPLPNAVDPTHNYNYIWQNTVDNDHHLELLRTDWNITPSMTFFARGVNSLERQSGEACCVNGNTFPHLSNSYDLHAKSLSGSLIKTFSPTLVNELNIGVSRQNQFLGISQETLDANNRSRLGVALPQFYPQANPLNLLPNATFSGVPNAISLSYESRFPFFGTGTLWTIGDNLSKAAGAHQLKAGFFAEIVARNTARKSSFNGAYDFGRNQVNPYDSNYAFTNAILGSINSYTESNIHPVAHGRYQQYEWYVQDNWRVSKRLTLDIGVRFYYTTPTKVGAGQQVALFNPQVYNASQSPQLIRPYKDPATGARAGIDPVTGEVVPQVKIGTFASGSGTPYQGTQLYTGTAQNNPGIKLGPRFGFAWDAFGNGKTVVRGGFGIFFDRVSDDTFLALVESPPLVQTPTANYTTITGLLGTPLSLSPANANMVQTDYQPPTVMNWSFGVQRDIGLGMHVDVAYVGAGGRHLTQSQDINATPYGTNFLASSQDSTNPGQPLPAAFLRPYRGFNSISYLQFGAPSHYHSLQSQWKRRFGRSLTYAVVWTWSKAIERGSSVAPFLDNASWNTDVTSFDRTHVVQSNFIYDLPKASKLWNHSILRRTLDDWQVSGVASFVTGAPSGVSYSFVKSTDLTGGTSLDSRVNVAGRAILPSGERSFGRYFDTTVFRSPVVSNNYGIGNASRYPVRLPGLNNWDLAIYKNIGWGKSESRQIQLRGELYNAFNHTQYNKLNTTSRWDANGNQANAQFGQVTGTAPARRIQIGIKLAF